MILDQSKIVLTTASGTGKDGGVSANMEDSDLTAKTVEDPFSANMEDGDLTAKTVEDPFSANTEG